MLVVISDLHFQDTSNDIIKDSAGNIVFDPESERNVPEEDFKMLVEDIIAEAGQNLKTGNANELILVLAGDIFDLTRSQQWLIKGRKPYDPLDQSVPIAVDIFNSAVSCNKRAIDAINSLTAECATQLPERDITVRVEFIPGNHERLLLHSLQLSQMLTSTLSIDEQGKHVEFCFNDTGGCFPDYGVLVRHGHEYDPYNIFGENNSAPLGEYITADIAVKLAFKFREKIRNGVPGETMKIYKNIYRAMLEFDDVRPGSAVFDYIRYSLSQKYNASDYYDDIIKEVVKEFLDIGAVQEHLKKIKSVWEYLALSAYSKFASGEEIGKVALSISNPPVWAKAARDEALKQNKEIKYIVAGHTHFPSITPLKVEPPLPGKNELYFFDTGTWRNVITQCSSNTNTFASAKNMTYAIFYKNDEDVEKKPSEANGYKKHSFSYWNGFRKKEILHPCQV